MDQYQGYIHASRYARWVEEDGRRETWEETVDRLINYFRGRDGDKIGESTFRDLRTAILNHEVMPSMRCLMTAGKALDRDNVAGYNCAYVAVDSPRVFDEIMYVLMCGTGVGFSVERQYINKLPEVAEEFHDTETTITVSDSKIGWASAYKELIAMLYAGNIPKWDDAKVRPAGARLRTFGGRASGPEPLRELYRFTVEHFRRASGRRFSSIEVHDLICKIAQVIVVGGVRRSALISLSNLSDPRMRGAKSGEWYHNEPQRALANNSVCYTEKPDVGIFMEEWLSLYRSKSGERGIFSRPASAAQAAKSGRRDVEHDFGCNPCSEIILRSKQFCNLTEVVVRPGDKLEELKRKVRLATILGTLQATLTDFRYLSKVWQRNTEEEALLGVSLTGIMDNRFLSQVSFQTQKWLQEMRKQAVDTNKLYAGKLGINPATAITCVKPSGTVSQLVNSASGIHPRYSRYYIRTVRADIKDPLAEWMIERGFPHERDRHQPANWVFSFPVEVDDEAVMRNDRSAIQQLEHWKMFQEHWCEHKPSITVYVREDEWFEVGKWVWDNFDIISGVSFLPHSDHIYDQAPYQEVDKATFDELQSAMPSVDWADFRESDDNTTSSQEFACTGGACEIK